MPPPQYPPQSLTRMITHGRVECSQRKTTCYQLGSTPSARQASARGPVYAAKEASAAAGVATSVTADIATRATAVTKPEEKKADADASSAKLPPAPKGPPVSYGPGGAVQLVEAARAVMGGRGGGAEVATSCPTRHLSLRKEDHGTAAREDLDFSMPRRYSLSNRQAWKDSVCVMGKFAPSRKPSGEVVATEGHRDVNLVP